MLNLSMGFCAIILSSNGKIQLAVAFVILGMYFDGLDGRLARKLKTAGELGKQLDSLSDIVSFGVAPAFCFGP